MKRSFLPYLILGLLALGGVGVTLSVSAAQSTDQTSEQDDDAGEQDDAVDPGTTAVSAAEARAIAEAAHPGVEITEVEFEVEGGTDAWEVEFADGTYLLVDATSGAVIQTGTDDD